MKKIILVLLILMFIAGVTGVVFLTQKREKIETSIDSIVPQGVIAYVGISDLKENLVSFRETAFWKQLSTVDYTNIMERNKVNEQQMALLDSILEQLSLPQNQKLFDKFFGEEIGLAVYSSQVSDLSLSGMVELISNMFIVTRLGTDAKFTEFLVGVFAETNAKITTDTKEYKDYTIHVVSSKEGFINASYVLIDDLLVFGLGEKAVRSCIDVAAGLEKPLAEDGKYVKIKARFSPEGDIVSYVDFGRLMKDAQEQLMEIAIGHPQSMLIKEQLEQSFEQVKGFESVGISGVFDDISTFKFILSFDKEVLDSEIRPIYECPPEENDTINFVPASVLGYQWGACNDFGFYWEQTKQEIAKSIEVSRGEMTLEAVIAEIEGDLQLSIENDILAAFGEKLGGYIADIETDGSFPVPKLLFFVEILDREKAEKVLGALISQQSFLRLEEESYDGKQIKFLQMPMINNIKPGYTYMADYLLIASNFEMLKEAMDVAKNPELSLAANPSFQKVNRGITDKNNSVVFLRVGDLVSKIEVIINWGEQWIESQQAQQQAFRRGGAQRLADMLRNVEKQEGRLSDLHAELSSIDKNLAESKRIKVVASGHTEEQLAQINKQIEAKNRERERRAKAGEEISEIENSLMALKESVQEMESAIQQFDNQASDIVRRQGMLNDFVKPFLRAFTAVKVLSGRMIFGDNYLEAISYFEVE